MKRTIIVKRISDKTPGAGLYTFMFKDDSEYEYWKFRDKFEYCKKSKIKWALNVIEKRLNTIERDGAEDEHFREEGLAVKALPFDIGSKIRLYCYRINVEILILGNGGLKPRNKKDKEKNKLKYFIDLQLYADTVRCVGEELQRQIDAGDIEISGNELEYLEEFEIEMPEFKTL